MEDLDWAATGSTFHRKNEMGWWAVLGLEELLSRFLISKKLKVTVSNKRRGHVNTCHWAIVDVWRPLAFSNCDSCPFVRVWGRWAVIVTPACHRILYRLQLSISRRHFIYFGCLFISHIERALIPRCWIKHTLINNSFVLLVSGLEIVNLVGSITVEWPSWFWWDLARSAFWGRRRSHNGWRKNAEEPFSRHCLSG